MKPFLVVVVVPLLAVIGASVVLLLMGRLDHAGLVSTLGTVGVMGFAVVYIVDSKERCK